MRFKLGLVIGGAVGYLLGSKAGREPYERLREMWDDFMGKPEVDRIRSEVREGVDAGMERVADRVGGAMPDAHAGNGGTGASASGTAGPGLSAPGGYQPGPAPTGVPPVTPGARRPGAERAPDRQGSVGT